MESRLDLAEYLDSVGADSRMRGCLLGLASAAVDIDGLIRRNGLDNAFGARDLGAEVGGVNKGGDSQKALDVRSEACIIAHLKASGDAAVVLSEEQDSPLILNEGIFNEGGGLVVAVDPLDGSSNISVNVTIGTIFALLPYDRGGGYLRKGREQLAAGFFAYGPQTVLILACAESDDVAAFVLDGVRGGFILTRRGIKIPKETDEFAINAAYARHWFAPVEGWMAETLSGEEACGKDYRMPHRMRWVGSLVADAWRIFERGGIFLYPSDRRPGYESGRLRLVYEANPIAFLAEKAGGLATDGRASILDIEVLDLHQRVPFFFGSEAEVARLMRHHAGC